MIMNKKIVYYLSTTLILGNSGFTADPGIAAPVDLSNVNQNYMSLMLGREGINAARGTDIQLRSMIDGAITCGITDRLYRFGDKTVDYKDQIARQTTYPIKKLHCQLAFAFYLVGFRGDFNNLDQIRAEIASLDANFDSEFLKLTGLVYTKGNIFAYRTQLEDVIKRASVPLNYDAPAVIARGGEVVAGKGTGGGVTPTPLRPAGMPTPPKPGQTPTGKPGAMPAGAPRPPGAPGQPKIPPTPGLTGNPGAMPEGAPRPPGAPAPKPLLVPGDRKERYYTDTEIEALGMPGSAQYSRMKASGKTPSEVQLTLKRMGIVIPNKFEGE